MSRPFLTVCKHGHDLTAEDACTWDAGRTRRWCRLCVEAKTLVANEHRKWARLHARHRPRLAPGRTMADLRAALGLPEVAS